MPRYRLTWLGKRLVRAEATITATSEDEARTIAERLPEEELRFHPVETAPVEAVRLVSLDEEGAEEPMMPATEPGAPAGEELIELVEAEAWRPALG